MIEQESKRQRIETTQETTIIDENDAVVKYLPKRIIRPKKTVVSLTRMTPSLIPYEMVWVHIRGYPIWPAIIEQETKQGKYDIHFFGDYTTATVTKHRIFHYLDGYKDYIKMKPSELLTKAVDESKIFIFEETKPTACYICEMIKLKRAKRAEIVFE